MPITSENPLLKEALPALGTEIYIPKASNCTGGKAIISKYEFYNKSILDVQKNTIRDKAKKEQTVGIMVKDNPAYIYVWENLSLRQEELKEEFQDTQAKYIPSFTPHESLKLPEGFEVDIDWNKFGFGKKRDAGMGITQFK